MEPSTNCALCPRLAAHRETLRTQHPDWHNAPVNAVGDTSAWLAIVGQAPGTRTANAHGYAFAGDPAADSLFAALQDAGLLSIRQPETPQASGDDSEYGVEDTLPPAKRHIPQAADLTFNGAYLLNAVRCAPGKQKLDPADIRNCRNFLEADLKAMPNLKVVIALGLAAHQSAIKALGGKLPKYPFEHGRVHKIHTGYIVIDGYHPGRTSQNQQAVPATAQADTLALALAHKAGHPARVATA